MSQGISKSTEISIFYFLVSLRGINFVKPNNNEKNIIFTYVGCINYSLFTTKKDR